MNDSNNRLQGTLHKVSGPLNRDVRFKERFMKLHVAAIAFCLLFSSCTSSRKVSDAIIDAGGLDELIVELNTLAETSATPPQLPPLLAKLNTLQVFEWNQNPRIFNIVFSDKPAHGLMVCSNTSELSTHSTNWSWSIKTEILPGVIEYKE